MYDCKFSNNYLSPLPICDVGDAFRSVWIGASVHVDDGDIWFAVGAGRG